MLLSPLYTVYWVASNTSTKYLLKMANYSPEPQTLSVEVEYSREGQFHLLAGLNATAHNSIDYDQDAGIYPEVEKLKTNDDYRYNITLTPWSVGVLETYAHVLDCGIWIEIEQTYNRLEGRRRSRYFDSSTTVINM